jgi:hypothetical protein
MTNLKPPNNNYPGAAAKGFIIGLSIMLAVCLIPAIINTSINQTLFKADFYSTVLKKTNFYDQMPVILGETVMASGSTALQGSLLAGLDQEQFKWLMTSLLPSGWIEVETEAAMASVVDFMNFETDSLSIIVDLQPIKDHLASAEGKQAVINLLDNLPDCSFDQLTQIMIAVQSGQGEFALCRPPLSGLFNIDIILDPVIDSFSASLPAAIILPPAGQAGIIENLVKSPVFQIYKKLRSTLSLFPWICLMLSLLIILLSIRSIRWLTGALGFPLIFASVASALAGVWLYMSGGADFGALYANTGTSGTLQGLEGLLIEVFQKGLQTAGQALIIWCLGIFLLGLVLLVVRRVTKR